MKSETRVIKVEQYLHALGQDNFHRGAQQIHKRLLLQGRVSRLLSENADLETIQACLRPLYEEPMSEWGVQYNPGPMLPGEGRIIRYVKGRDVQYMVDGCALDENHNALLNELGEGALPAPLYEGKVFALIDIRGNWLEIQKSVKVFVEDAQKRFNVVGRKLPTETDADTVLRRLEKMLADHDFRLLKKYKLIDQSRADFAASINQRVGEGSKDGGEPLSALDKMWKSWSQVISLDYAVQLDELAQARKQT